MADSTQRFTVSEFGIVFNIKGNAHKAIRQMAKDIRMFERKVTKLNKMGGLKMGGNFAGAAGGGGGGNGGGVRGHTPKFDTGRGKDYGGMLRDVALQTEILSRNLMAVSGAILGPLVDAFTGGIGMAAQLESSMAGLEFAAKRSFGDEYASTVAAKVEEVGLKTSQTTEQVRALTSALVAQKIDPFADGLDRLTLSTGGTTSAMEVMADASILARGGMGQLRMQIAEVVSDGKLVRRGLRDTLNLSMAEMKQWNKALAGASGQQEKFNSLMQVMATRFGGASSAQSKMLSHVMNQWDDYHNKVITALFIDTGITQMFADAFKSVQEWMDVILKDPEKLKALQETMKDIASVVLSVGKAIAYGVGLLVEFTLAHPWIIKVAIAFAILVGVLAGVLALVAAIVGGIAGMMALWIVIGPYVASAAASMALALGIAIAVAVVFATMARHFLKADSWADTWERLKTVFSGVREILSNIDEAGNSFLSEDLGKKLADMGLLEDAILWAKGLNNVWNMFKGIWGGLKQVLVPALTLVANAFSALLVLMGDLIGGFLEMFGLTSLFGLTAEGAADKWTLFGTIIGWLTGLFVAMWLVGILGPIGLAIIAFGAFLYYFEDIANFMKEVIDWISNEISDMLDDLPDWLTGEASGPQGERGARATLGGGSAAAGEVVVPDVQIETARAQEAVEPIVAERGRIQDAREIERDVQSGDFEKGSGEEKMTNTQMRNLASMVADAVKGVSLTLDGRELNEGIADSAREAHGGGT